MTNNSSRVFLRLSDVCGVTDDELKAILGPEIEVVGITRGSPSKEHAGEECAVVTLRGDRRSIKTKVEQQFEAFRHPHREPYPDFDFKGFTPLTNGHTESDAGLIEYLQAMLSQTQLTGNSVIAVAGLGGNAFATWQGAKIQHLSHWLRDYLPKDLKNARVWIYGYKSELSDDSNMASTLHFAELLRHDLVTTAERYKMQNIILMGHSLGCILIKKALVDLPREHELFNALIALVFFGAPHKGFEIRALSDYAFTTLRQQRIQTIISELGADSSFLGSLHRDFMARLDISLPHIITIYETRATPTLAQDPVTLQWTRTGPAVQAVPLSSAKLDLQEKYETLLSAPYNHSDIAKVTKEADHVYRRLVSVLEKLIKKRMSNVASTISSGSVSGTTNSSQGLLLSQDSGGNNSKLRMPPMAQRLPSSVEMLLGLPNTSWISVPPVSNAMNAAFLQSLSSSSISQSEDNLLLPDPLRMHHQAIPAQPDITSTPTNPPSTDRISHLSPSTSIDNLLSPARSPPVNQKIKRRAVPTMSPSSLSTIFPSAGLGVNVQFGKPSNPFRNTGSVISLPDSVKEHPTGSRNDFPEVVERNDWPEDLSSLPSITLRPASSVKDYKPFRFEPITRYLHHSTLVVLVGRDVPAATPNNTGITPIKFQTNTVSNPHCEFSYRKGQWFVRDVGSGNGTWLNGVRLSDSREVSQKHLVIDQSLIKLGSQHQDGKDNHQRCVRMIVDFSDEQ